jgi:oxygen-independent coproporphyrinogen-3 oxidase
VAGGQEIDLDPAIAARYDNPVPRYTSYPPVPYWSTKFGPADLAAFLEKASRSADAPLSLYVHLPFCVRRCLFCSCNVQITSDPSKPERYVPAILEEARLLAERLGERRKLSQLHYGGGTPTHLAPAQLTALTRGLLEHFEVLPGAELSAEVHPTVTTEDHVRALADLGFDRLSMGVQDLDPEVQRVIRRDQTFEETARLCGWARDAGMKSLNIDLIYGLPLQLPEGWDRTLEQVISLKPERLAVYSYAHLPEIFRHQKLFDPAWIPKGKEKLALFLSARSALLDAGYRSIGFDHFAFPQDELARAFDSGTLRRNFMGYTTQAGTDMIAMGVSAISDVAGAYAQDDKDLLKWHERIQRGELPVAKGMALSAEDLARRDAIMGWLNRFGLQPDALRETHGDAAAGVLADAEEKFPARIEEGLVERAGPGYRATLLGRVFARWVASDLDAYFGKGAEGAETRPAPLFSRGV